MIKKFKEYNELRLPNFLSKFSIKVLLKKFNIKNYTINSDLSIDVNGSVNLGDMLGWQAEMEYGNIQNFERIPFKFNSVGGDFHCVNNDLIDLSGCPKHVGGDFNCSRNNLTSLEYCPEYIGGIFNFERNAIHNLNFKPKEVGKGFFHRGNPVSDILDQVKVIEYSRYSYVKMNPKILEVWNSFTPIYEKDGKWYVIEYRFKEMYYYLTGKDYVGEFPNFHPSYLENSPERGGFPYIIIKDN